MQKINTLALLLAALMAAACSNGNSTQLVNTQTGNGVPPVLSAVGGSSLDGVSFSSTPDKLIVNFESVLADGQYVELTLPVDVSPVGQHWTGNEDTLSLMLHSNGIVQVGVAPLAAYQGNPVTVSLSLGQFAHNVRKVSRVPTGQKNQLVDLTIEDQGDGSAKLEWSEVNRGDYDFNSEVNIADLTPIAIYFQTTAPTADPSTTTYWVDGDNNGEINLADITQIALNFASTIKSYKVVTPDATWVDVPRGDSIHRAGLPPKYSVTIPGGVAETWQVLPIGGDGEEGDPTEPVIVSPPDLLLDVNIAGVDFFDLDGSGSFGPVGAGRLMSYLIELEPLRRILPGEIPNMIEIGTALNQTTPAVKLYGLPRDRYLAMVLLYIPTVDLTTGLPRGLSALPGENIWEYDPVVTIVPFNLHGLELNAHATVDLSLAPGPFDGYYSDITTSGLGLHPGLVKLDYGDGVLNRDSNGNLDFADEAQLLDEPRWGITNARLEQLAQLDEYASGENIPFVLNAIINVYNQGGGEIGLKETTVIFDGQEPPVELGEIALAFSEYATFASKLFGFEDESPINPGIIEFGTELEITGYKLVDDLGGLEAVFWGEHIVKIIR